MLLLSLTMHGQWVLPHCKSVTTINRCWWCWLSVQGSMNSPISLQIGPCLNNFAIYHVSIACFTKRAWRLKYLRALTFFGSHKNFCRLQKGNYNGLSVQEIEKHKQIRILPLQND